MQQLTQHAEMSTGDELRCLHQPEITAFDLSSKHDICSRCIDILRKQEEHCAPDQPLCQTHRWPAGCNQPPHRDQWPRCWGQLTCLLGKLRRFAWTGPCTGLEGTLCKYCLCNLLGCQEGIAWIKPLQHSMTTDSRGHTRGCHCSDAAGDGVVSCRRVLLQEIVSAERCVQPHITRVTDVDQEPSSCNTGSKQVNKHILH